MTRAFSDLRKTLQRTSEDEKSLDVEDAFQYVSALNSLPEGTFFGQALSPEMRQELTALCGVSPEEPVILAYCDRLLGRVLQCAVLTPGALYGAPSAGELRQMKVEDILTTQPADWHLDVDLVDGASPKFRPRFRGFFRLVIACVAEILAG